MVANNLVNNNLGYQGHAYAHQLQEKGCSEYLCQRTAVSLDNHVEPRQIVPLFEITPVQLAREGYNVSLPAFYEFFVGKGYGVLHAGIYQEYSLVSTGGNNHIAAIVHPGDNRQLYFPQLVCCRL